MSLCKERTMERCSYISVAQRTSVVSALEERVRFEMQGSQDCTKPRLDYAWSIYHMHWCSVHASIPAGLTKCKDVLCLYQEPTATTHTNAHDLYNTKDLWDVITLAVFLETHVQASPQMDGLRQRLRLSLRSRRTYTLRQSWRRSLQGRTPFRTR